MANSKVEAELLKALKIKKQKSSEDEQDYLARVLKEIDGLEDEVWSDLSAAAQKWANEAAKKAKAKKDLPSFPVDEDDEDEAEEDGADEDEKEEDEDEDEEEDKKPAKKSAKKEEKKPAKKEEKKPAKEDKKKKAKDEDEDEDEDADEEEDEDDSKSKKKAASKEKPKSEGSKRSGATGVTACIKNIMLEDPQISVEDLTKKLGKAGFDTISNMTVSTVRADFRHTLKIMHAANALSKAVSAKMSDE